MLLLDVSPDIKYQIDIAKRFLNKNLQKRRFPIDSVVLTHAHYGHIAGLWQLGNECSDVSKLAVHCTHKMVGFLENNHPFTHLLERGNLVLNQLEINQESSLEGFSMTAFEVPHRNEHADTVGYHLKNEKEFIYLPDLDYWTDEIICRVKQVDFCIIDGSFYSSDELPRYNEVPHPPINETMELFGDCETELIFSHFNHTNPILDEESKERKEVTKRGFKLADDGLVLEF